MKQIVLINLYGAEQPGIAAAVCHLLADHNSQILDIGQEVIHQQLSLGVLVQLPDSGSCRVLLADLDSYAKAHGLTMQTQEVDQETYEQWRNGQGRERHIVTLLARGISAAQVAAVIDVAERHQLTVDNINRLSGRPQLESVEPGKACVEFSIRGAAGDLSQLRAEFMALTNDHDIDIAVQDDHPFRRHRRLVCFDMDSTLIEAEVIDELAKVAGVGDQVSEITEAAMQGEIDFRESFKRRMALLKGLDESVLAGIAERLPIMEGAPLLIASLKKLGYKTAILSGGFTYFGHYLQKKLGIDHVYANQLEIVDGKLTGRVIEPVVDGERKAQLLTQLAAEQGLSLHQVVAVGDGANDLPMLSLAGLGIAFRAKPRVREAADHSIRQLGLDGILYLLGVKDQPLYRLFET